MSVDQWTREGNYRFYFEEAYDRTTKEIFDLPIAAEKYGNGNAAASKGKGKGNEHFNLNGSLRYLSQLIRKSVKSARAMNTSFNTIDHNFNIQAKVPEELQLRKRSWMMVSFQQ